MLLQAHVVIPSAKHLLVLTFTMTTGSMFFSMGKQALQQVYNEVCAWPAPTAGHLLQLQVRCGCRIPLVCGQATADWSWDCTFGGPESPTPTPYL